MRAKFKVSHIHRNEAGDEVVMNPVCKSGHYGDDGLDEDNTFSKFSPSGELRLMITNPALISQINPGETYYLDFTPVPAPAANVPA